MSNKAPFPISHRPAGYEAWRDQEPRVHPDLRPLITLALVGVVGCFLCWGGTMTASYIAGQAAESTEDALPTLAILPTLDPSITPTETTTSTATATATNTLPPMFETMTQYALWTATATETPTSTPTATPSETITNTPIVTFTLTPSRTARPASRSGDLPSYPQPPQVIYVTVPAAAPPPRVVTQEVVREIIVEVIVTATPRPTETATATETPTETATATETPTETATLIIIAPPTTNPTLPPAITFEPPDMTEIPRPTAELTSEVTENAQP